MAYKVEISALDQPIVTLKIEKRIVARYVAIAAKENDLNCVVTAEVKAREVKFKGM